MCYYNNLIDSTLPSLTCIYITQFTRYGRKVTLQLWLYLSVSMLACLDLCVSLFLSVSVSVSVLILISTSFVTPTVTLFTETLSPSWQEADESLNFEEQILEAAKSIAAATSALVKAASAAQRELVAQGKVSPESKPL